MGMRSGEEQAFWLAHLGKADRFSAWVVSEIAPFLGNRVLEVGCGTGNFTRSFAASGKRVLALDIDRAFVETARRTLAAHHDVRVECGDVMSIALEQEHDTVVMLDVLEHIADDVGILRKLRNAIVPGGNIVIKVPAHSYIYGRMDQAIGHFRRYDRKSLTLALNAAGYDIISLRSFNSAGLFGWWLNSKVLKRRTPPAEQLVWFDQLVPWLARAEHLFRPPIGLSLIAAAVRSERALVPEAHSP